jgi:hypothetical protein
MFLRAQSSERCCLCARHGKMSGEHKIKASALRRLFGETRFQVVRDSEFYDGNKIAQGTRSQIFHFRQKICVQCNGTKSQLADRAFDRMDAALQKLASETPLGNADLLASKIDGLLADGGFEPDAFRYFSKLICLRIAESQGPTPVFVAKHAIGEFEKNRMWVHVRPTPFYEEQQGSLGSEQFAGHGGLVIIPNGKSGLGSLASSLSLNRIQYVFHFHWHWAEALEMRLLHRKFIRELRRSSEHRVLDESDELARFYY